MNYIKTKEDVSKAATLPRTAPVEIFLLVALPVDGLLGVGEDELLLDAVDTNAVDTNVVVDELVLVVDAARVSLIIARSRRK